MLPEAGFYSSLSKTENSIHASVISINLILKTGPSSTVFKYTFKDLNKLQHLYPIRSALIQHSVFNTVVILTNPGQSVP